jgi:tRNA(His) 5'-end guanylyltransferase
MEKTTFDLVNEFNAYTGYTQSDEITLFIPSLQDKTIDNCVKKSHKLDVRVKSGWTHIYSGRVQKIVSLIASFATMRFNKHLFDEVQEKHHYFLGYISPSLDKDSLKKEGKYFDLLRNKKVGNAWFDARVYGVDTLEEVFNSFLWRVRDAEKNSKAVYAYTFCSHKPLLNKNGLEMIEYCLEKTGNDWNTLEDRYKYGIFVKKETYEKEIDKNQKTFHNRGIVQETVTRSRFVSFSQKLTFSDKNLKVITGQYLNG